MEQRSDQSRRASSQPPGAIRAAATMEPTVTPDEGLPPVSAIYFIVQMMLSVSFPDRVAGPALPNAALAAIFAECDKQTRSGARQAHTALLDPAALATTTLAGTVDALPVPWAAFPRADKLWLGPGEQEKQRLFRLNLAHINDGRLRGATTAGYVQAIAQLPLRVQQLALTRDPIYVPGTIGDEEGQMLVDALRASPPAASGSLRSLTIMHDLGPVTAQALASGLTSLTSLAMGIKYADGLLLGGGDTMRLKVGPQLRELELTAASGTRGHNCALKFGGGGAGASSSVTKLTAMGFSSIRGLQRLAGSLEELTIRDRDYSRMRHNLFEEMSTSVLVPIEDIAALARLTHLSLADARVTDQQWRQLAGQLPELRVARFLDLSIGLDTPPAAALEELTIHALVWTPPGGEQQHGCVPWLMPCLKRLTIEGDGRGGMRLIDTAKMLHGHPEILQLELRHYGTGRRGADGDAAVGSEPWAGHLRSLPKLQHLLLARAPASTGLLEDLAACSRLETLELKLGGADAVEPFRALVWETLLCGSASRLCIKQLVLRFEEAALGAPQVAQLLLEVMPQLEKLAVGPVMLRGAASEQVRALRQQARAISRDGAVHWAKRLQQAQQAQGLLDQADRLEAEFLGQELGAAGLAGLQVARAACCTPLGLGAGVEFQCGACKLTCTF